MATNEQEQVSSSQAGSKPPGGAPLIRLTSKAVEMIKVVLQRDGVPGQGLRVGVRGGGCSGLEYHLGFEESPAADDTVVEVEGVRVFVDEKSRSLLQGVTLDYVTALHGAGFKFINPNASRTCGCGSSFAT